MQIEKHVYFIARRFVFYQLSEVNGFLYNYGVFSCFTLETFRVFSVAILWSMAMLKNVTSLYYFVTYVFFPLPPERVYLHPRRASRCPDWQRLLGVVLPGAWHPARRPDAL